ncbi:hypothetical protein D3C84_871830 [compost metagenome]
MDQKVNETLSMYKAKLERKEKFIKPLREKQSIFEEFTKKEELTFTQLSTEINMLKLFIEELEYFLEPVK